MKHVVSLELAKKLVDVGIVVDSYFVWCDIADCRNQHHDRFEVVESANDYCELPFVTVVCPAPLPCELMELLPFHFHVWKRYAGKYVCRGQVQCVADSLADALAKMLLWLKEEHEI